MEKPERFPVVLTVVMALVATVLCTIGSFGYLAFGSEVKTVALLNLPDGPFSSIVQLGYALAVHLTNPLALFPTIRIVEHGLFGERTGKHNITIKWQKNALRCGIVVLGAFIAWGGANDLDKFISLIGSICCCKLLIFSGKVFLKRFNRLFSRPSQLDISTAVSSPLTKYWRFSKTHRSRIGFLWDCRHDVYSMEHCSAVGHFVMTYAYRNLHFSIPLVKTWDSSVETCIYRLSPGSG